MISKFQSILTSITLCTCFNSSLCGEVDARQDLNEPLAQEKIEYNLVEGLANVYLDPKSEKIGCTWVNGIVWDKPLIQRFYSILKEHNRPFTIIDVGAQTGCFSLLAKYFPDSQWYAFEPLQEASEVLRTNLSINEITNVSIYPMAASNFTGTVTINVPAIGELGLATIGGNVLNFTPVENREIACIDLDSFIATKAIDKVDFMKLDVEGYELNVLKGAKNTILRDHPLILMEYNSSNMRQCNINREEIHEFLREMGYSWASISSDDILCTFTN